MHDGCQWDAIRRNAVRCHHVGVSPRARPGPRRSSLRDCSPAGLADATLHLASARCARAARHLLLSRGACPCYRIGARDRFHMATGARDSRRSLFVAHGPALAGQALPVSNCINIDLQICKHGNSSSSPYNSCLRRFLHRPAAERALRFQTARGSTKALAALSAPSVDYSLIQPPVATGAAFPAVL